MTKLNLHGPELEKELGRLTDEKENAFDAQIDTEGVTAEVSHTTQSRWSFIAYVKRKWQGDTIAGGRIKKEF